MPKIEGKVVAVSPVGNLVTDITEDRLLGAPRDERLSVACDEHITAGIFPPDHHQPPMTFLSLLAEGGSLELAIVDDSAAAMLGIRIGERVVVSW
jgi:S-adenosylmethionine hydrolase